MATLVVMPIPSFDVAIVAVLKFLGVSAGVLIVIASLFAVYSWYAGVKQVATGAVVTGRALGRFARDLVAGPAQGVVAIVATVAVPAAQAVGLLGWLFMGNLCTLPFRSHAEQPDSSVSGKDTGELVSTILTPDLFALNWVSMTCLLVGVWIVLSSYRSPASEPPVWFLLPALFVTGAPVIVAAFYLLRFVILGLVDDFNSAWAGLKSSEDAKFWLIFAVIGIAYLGTSVFAMRGASFLGTYWRSRGVRSGGLN
jgi:hypothetical protein